MNRRAFLSMFCCAPALGASGSSELSELEKAWLEGNWTVVEGGKFNSDISEGFIRVPEWNPKWLAAGMRHTIFSVRDLEPDAELPPGYRQALVAAIENGTAEFV